MYISPMRQKKYGYDVWQKFYLWNSNKKIIFGNFIWKPFTVDFHRLFWIYSTYIKLFSVKIDIDMFINFKVIRVLNVY